MSGNTKITERIPRLVRPHTAKTATHLNQTVAEIRR